MSWIKQKNRALSYDLDRDTIRLDDLKSDLVACCNQFLKDGFCKGICNNCPLGQLLKKWEVNKKNKKDL